MNNLEKTVSDLSNLDLKRKHKSINKQVIVNDLWDLNYLRILTDEMEKRNLLPTKNSHHENI